jgi:hypothetical protein
VFPVLGSDWAGRKLFRAACCWNLDLSLVKRFDVTERVKVQFRAETFNVFEPSELRHSPLCVGGLAGLHVLGVCPSLLKAVAPPTTQSIIQTGESARDPVGQLKLKF